MKFNRMKAVSLLLILSAFFLLANGSYIHLKAQLAQWLIASAWQQTTVEQAQAKPWPWADTWPVARLIVPQHNIDQYVLAGVSGESLAFGPGYVFSSAAPAEEGNTIIAAHRDTHFEFLQNLQQGELITIQNVEGHHKNYVVQDMFVVDKQNVDWLKDDLASHQLTLITCYPFNTLQVDGRLRYVVRAVEQQKTATNGDNHNVVLL